MTHRPRLEPLEDRTNPVPLIGLGVGGSANALFFFDSEDPLTITNTLAVTNLPAGSTLVGIDFRPANAQLYGVAVNGTTVSTVRIDTATGGAVTNGSAQVAVSGATAYGVDFNPVTDQIRVVTSLDSDGGGGRVNNFRLNPGTGALAGIDTDLDYTGLTTFNGVSAGPEVAIAHDTNTALAASTKLYGIVSGSDELVYHLPSSPALNTLFEIGPLFVDTNTNAGLDVYGPANTAYAVLGSGNRSSLYLVDLASGSLIPRGVVGAGNTPLGDVAIDPTPPLVRLAFDTPTLAEGEAANLVVSLSSSSVTPVTVSLIASGTAATDDYTASLATVTISPGETFVEVPIAAVLDPAVEPDESLIVEIEAVTDGTEDGIQTATLTITDQGSRPSVTLKADAAALAERNGTVTLTATLSRASGLAVNVPLTFGGTAVLDADYSASFRQLVFAPGQTSQSFRIAAVDDTAAEPDETIVVGMGTPNNATKGTPAEVTVTLVDNDGGSSQPPPGPPPPIASGVRIAVGAGAGLDSRVVLAAADGSADATLYPFDSVIETGFTGGARVAVADVNADGTDDVIVGSGPGRSAQFRVYDGVTRGLLFGRGAAFEPAFTGGAFVAAGDVNGDGRADVAVSADEGGGPRVRVLDGATGTQITDFLGIEDPNFRGGARVALGDVNGDGKADLVVAAGFGGGPRVAVYDGASLKAGAAAKKLFGDFFVFEQSLRNGVYVAAGDITGDGLAELIFGGGPGGGPRVLAISGAGLTAAGGPLFNTEANLFVGNEALRGGVRVAARDLNSDGVADLIVGSGDGTGAEVKAYSGRSIPDDGTLPDPLSEFVAIPDFANGVYVG